MIQVTYRRHRVGESLGRGYEDIAYFPTWKAAMILMARWNDGNWVYEVKQVQKVANDSDRWHKDCIHYRHLWDGK